jgi:isopentenyl phosphate kinase
MFQSNAILLKLGGSLITDKTRPYTARLEVLARLAHEIRRGLSQLPNLRLVIGHGSGSFGHWSARPYATREGVRTPDQWQGYAEVAAAAARLNRIVTDALLEASVPVLSLQPSASALCHDYRLEYMDTRPLYGALAQGLVPLVYGDVALDDVRGGTIVSTEDIFVYLAGELQPSRILLLGEAPGVLRNGAVVPSITPGSLQDLRCALDGSRGVDVTGGMADKVLRMVELVQHCPDTCVHILSGTKPGLLAQVLLDPEVPVGTRITAA